MSRLFTHHDRLILWSSKPSKPVKEGEDEEEHIEDPTNFMVYVPHVHKFFGLFALINIAFYITPLYGFAQAYVGAEKLRWLAHVHVLLALTSFEFRIGRNRSNALYTIYREMQLHTCIFTMRSWAIMMGGMYFGVQSVLVRSCYTLFWHVLADLATKYFGTPTGGTTIRRTTDGGKTSGYKDFSLATRIAVWFFSFSQLVGTYMLLTDSVDSVRMAMCVMGPVQISAFLATLVRKGYFHSRTSFVCYLTILTPIFFIHQWRPVDMAMILIVTILRFNLRLNKYVMWVGVALGYAYLTGELAVVVDKFGLGQAIAPPELPLLWNNSHFAGIVTDAVSF